METGICLLSVIPVREKPSDKSQMIHQLLFGETVKISDRMNSWLLIRSSGNDYEGWVDSNQITPIDVAFFDKLEKENPVYLVTPYLKAGNKNNSVLLSLGSRLPFYKNHGFEVAGAQYSFELVPEIYEGKKSGEALISLANRYLGIPYLWGGRSYFGLDCSGFTEVVFRTCGYQLPRDSADQAHVGKTIGFINEAQAGDLAFFDNEEEQIVHVGILLNNTQIIHASGSVRIDSIDHQGIFNKTQQKYTHKLRLIKRVLS
jgi:hypothetical protein